MRTEDQIEESKIIDYLSGSDLPENDIEKIVEWLSNENNVTYAEEIYKAWEISALLLPKRVSTAQALNKVKVRLGLDHHGTFRSLSLYIAAAASLFLLAIVALSLYTQEPTNVVQTYGSTESINTPDGSLMRLNKNTSVKYDEKKFNEQRKLYLSGEAYFEVTHLDGSPFIVYTQTAEIRVLGTKFLVKANTGEPVQVLVTEGGVLVKDKITEEEYTVNAGTEVVLSNSSQLSGADTNKLYWVTGTLQFENESLKNVFEKIGVAYSTKIELSAATIGNCRLTATFSKQPIATVIAVIAKTHNLSVVKNNNVYLISGNGCM